MLFIRPFITILLAQTAGTAPAPAPAPAIAPELLPQANNLSPGDLVLGIGSFVKRLVGLAPRDEVKAFGDYGSYGKYGSYGSYPDIGGEVSGEVDNKVDTVVETSSTTTLTTTMPVFTTTITLRSKSTASPTVTAVSTDRRL
ncbi:hypothetical protein J7T55_002948 [Diaporthe amygdali]|uniref:uncharacterized protein n=1 Tax=Phomopsis amygdali TaxID=1214568 RepID=UPI0022FDFFBA|nr:uncharacterized protein J7T55_002948 [Diaporthe amygdali]KAJ0122435.1 hypothetical protein J7T55_002948 [Diaporthe amygdali]